MGAPSPPAQTPVTILNGGAGAMFSAHCKSEIARLGLSPDDFGSYRHTKQRINEAKDRVKRGTADAHDRELAGCTPSHLEHDATFRKPGRFSRGDCDYMVDGRKSADAPCMPLRADEEERMKLDESRVNQQHLANGVTPDTPAISPEQQDAAADGRLRNVPRLQDKCADVGTAPPVGSAQGTAAVTAPGEAAATSGAAAGAPTKPSGPSSPTIDGANVIECINEFRRRANAAMKAEFVENLEANQKLANGVGPDGRPNNAADGAAHRAKLQTDYDSAFVTSADPGKDPAVASARERLGVATNANCRAEAGQRLADGNPNVDARVIPPFSAPALSP